MSVITPYDRGAGPLSIFNLTEADEIQNLFLGSATAESITVTAGMKAMLVRCDSPVYYRVDADPVVPTTEIASDGSILIPAEMWEGDNWDVTGAPTTVRFIRANAVDTILTVLFYNN